VADGQLISARKLFATLHRRLSGFDYEGEEEALLRAEKVLIDFDSRVAASLGRLAECADALSKAPFFKRASAKQALQNAVSDMVISKGELHLAASRNVGSEEAQLLVDWVQSLDRLETIWSQGGVTALIEETRRAIRARIEMGLGGCSPGERLLLGSIAVRWIPAGGFSMGSPFSEEGRSRDEGQHEVVLTRGF
jgi:hypothetical protein